MPAPDTVSHSRYPRYAKDFADLTGMLEAHLIPPFIPKSPIFDAASKIGTQGSCFAENLAASLQKAGASAHCMQLAEAINSPLANRILLEHALYPKKPYSHPRLEEYFNRAQAAQLRDSIATFDVYVVTCGLAFSWFSKANGKPTVGTDTDNLHLYKQRLEGVRENAEHIRAMVTAIRAINRNIKIVLTVSPVPMAVDFSGRPAMVADMLSKSTLRLALDDFMKSAPQDIYYWPALEIVRWVGGHTGPVFGADDGNARHVNIELVDLIVRLFLKHFGRGMP